jgi:hypothetical protein
MELQGRMMTVVNFMQAILILSVSFEQAEVREDNILKTLLNFI